MDLPIGATVFPGSVPGNATACQGRCPILDLNPPDHVTPEQQRQDLDLLASLNQKHLSQRPGRTELEARLQSYELAYRMQVEVPDVLELGNETQKTLEMYGINESKTAEFGRKCLLARRLIEKGVRFVQVFRQLGQSRLHPPGTRSLIKAVDQPIAALIKDLKQRDLLKDTLIVCCGEFGRTPDNGQRSGGKAYGRDHNANAMAMWFAGGGTKAGHTVGATDEIGGKAVECAHHIRDVHVTLLHLLGLDDNRLNFYHAGRFKQLSQFGGQVINEIIS